jgi:protein ImuA
MTPVLPIGDQARRAALLARLRTAVAGHEARSPAAVAPIAPGIDAALPGGGLARGAIHEILAVETGPSTAFCAHALSRAGGMAAWIAPPGATDMPWPHGLAAFGLDPAALLFCDAKGGDALWAAEQALRCTALAAVVATLPRLDLAAARRLQLAAEAGGTLGLLLRPEEAEAGPGVARTRWRVTALPGAGAAPHRLGAAHWKVALLHARGGRPACWEITWDITRKTLIVNDRLSLAADA